MSLGLSDSHIVTPGGEITPLGALLVEYFQFRAEILNDTVQHLFMDALTAKATYEQHRDELHPTLIPPMNKQKGEKKDIAFLTAIVNAIVESRIGDLPCNYDPRNLTTFTLNGAPLRTFARRFDGAFPGVVNPIALWEVKEYYYTTTFGSKIPDGIYSTMLDGVEIDQLVADQGISPFHCLFVDGYRTWWQDGRSYLCRMIDMLHMGYVDEVIFGREVVEVLPQLVDEWVQVYNERGGSS
ncbi:MAG: hypothetical protein KF883_00775 [Thermomicrobiales bacterium]|nr:hypothetical protein [Thermomicrobiales bacterium]